MKILIKNALVLVALVVLSGCSLKKQKRQLKQEQIQLHEKEQELALKEQELDVRERLLDQRQQNMDSTLIHKDTLSKIYPKLQGTWRVKMSCTDATCAGSAIGDVKVEHWAISFQNNMMVVKAMNNRLQLSRIYTGNISPMGRINLLAQSLDDSIGNTSKVRIIVQLKQTKKDEMTGQREIIQPNDCHVIYSLNLEKQ